jgi:predicted GTPase
MMEARELDDLLETLHEDVLQSFSRIVALLGHADRLGVSWSGDLADTATATARMHEHAESVRRLELIMPIVAPMKAGKSTLINAIVGYPLLPARANPMTTLPTKIKLVDGLDLAKPELVLTDSTIALLNRVGDQIGQCITQTGWKVPSAHSYLAELADLIASGQAEPLRTRYQGGPAIRDVLMRLNDQLRLAVLATGENLMGDIVDLPEISTGHRAIIGRGPAGSGQLVIVDTPGPNEHAMAAHLGPAMEQQLQQSHVVLVVLDYTQMGADAADEVKARLLPQIKIITTSKIFAVVNKVDERKKPEDLTKEQTRAAVCAAIGLSPEQGESQVFETVARWGLNGAQLLADIDQFGDDLIPEQTESAVALLREVAPLHWQRRIKQVSVAELKDDAVEILAQSGLQELLGSAIARLKSGAAPTVIESGVHRYQDALAKLTGILVLELKAAERGSEVVARELAVLAQEMTQLQNYQDTMPDVTALERRFSKELKDFVKVLSDHGREVIDLVRESASGEGPEAAGSAIGPVGDAFHAIFRHTRKMLWEGVLRGRPADDVHEFDTLDQAQAFMTSITGQVTEELRQLLDYARQELDKRARKLAAIVVAEQESKVRGLVERAAAKLSVAFEVKLQVPPPAIVNGELAVDLADPSVRSWSTSENYSTTERHRVWYKLWMGYRDVVVTKTASVSHHRYQVSRQEIAAQLSTAFNSHLAEISNALDGYVATDVNDRLTVYYASLRKYLESYFAALKRSQDGFKDDESAKETRRQDLSGLRAAVSAEQQKLTGYLSRIADYSGQAELTASPPAASR